MKKTIARILFFTIPAIVGMSEIQAQQSAIQPGIDLKQMDLKIKPNDDFFQFVNGTWLDKTEIPADKKRWGSFDELRQNTDRDALEILNDATKNPKYTSATDQGKAINLYKTILDTVARDKAGVTPLKPLLTKINAIKNSKDLQKLMIEMEPYGGIGFFGAGIGPDRKNSNRNVAYVGTARVGLPDRDYYVSEEKDSKEKRDKYVAHVAKMLQFLGDSPAKAKTQAASILALETALITPTFTRVERRDSRNTYNPMSVSDLQKLMPSVNWNEYFNGIGFTKLDSLNVSQPKYLTALDGILKANNVESWKAYLRWTALNNVASMLSTDIDNANWEFYGKTLTGAPKKSPADERALQVINGNVGEALGKLYVEKKFPAEAKAKAEIMIKYVFRAFETRIENLAWMSAETKKSAVAKLHKSRVKIGYPDKWKDYSQLTIKNSKEGGSYFSNMMAVRKWRFNEDLAELNLPVNKEEWGMSPQTVNAYYSSSFNEIVFPAAILQPPFYDYKADEAINFGGIGGVIGHEISHGFDDSGSRYNAEGNMIDWWTAEDLTQFTALTGALADQYSALQPLPETFVDGKFTLGENIGDLGGVNAAYDGLQLYLNENGRPELIDGFTPEQRFFISWATIWRSKMRDEAIKNQVKTDPHSPGMYRSYVPLQNIDSFYKAFDIKSGDGMYIEPSKRVKIW
jgi:putative endopeptidase